MSQPKTYLDCPVEKCRAIIPVRFDPEDRHEGTYRCLCEDVRVRLRVGEGVARAEVEKEKI